MTAAAAPVLKCCNTCADAYIVDGMGFCLNDAGMCFEENLNGVWVTPNDDQPATCDYWRANLSEPSRHPKAQERP